ncbi:lytic transglycosylase domain-containing protein [Streptomyces gobiensis]|uniref:lytic transglycosylase domain-containing protein n=1 Tax=Streptomyces gobiensis TaxID=2875706 RepID=UPI001E29BBA5|nr:lytic transglycosylase domain-containing protein [Streptomyces gobiensis]UGY90635.1 lytic transglycosylase domain-containing protein [Streptomyces gobiensis]
MPVHTAPLSRRQTRARKAAVGFTTVGAVTLAFSALTGTAHAQPQADKGRSAQQTASLSAELAAASSGDSKKIAKKLIGNRTQYQCFAKIVEHESGWDHTARNSSSGAYGLVQALPATKMASAGSDWRTNPATQIKWGMDYMKDRYGSPCDAWSFWQKNNWY